MNEQKYVILINLNEQNDYFCNYLKFVVWKGYI